MIKTSITLPKEMKDYLEERKWIEKKSWSDQVRELIAAKMEQTPAQ